MISAPSPELKSRILGAAHAAWTDEVPALRPLLQFAACLVLAAVMILATRQPTDEPGLARRAPILPALEAFPEFKAMSVVGSFKVTADPDAGRRFLERRKQLESML